MATGAVLRAFPSPQRTLTRVDVPCILLGFQSHMASGAHSTVHLVLKEGSFVYDSGALQGELFGYVGAYLCHRLTRIWSHYP